MYQLPGPMFPSPTTRRASIAPRLSALILVWLLLASAGFGLYRFYTSRRTPPRPTTNTISAAVIDAARHMEEASAMTGRAQAQIKTTEATIRQLLHDADRTQAPTMRTSLGTLRAARQELDRVRAELDFIRATLQGDKK